MLTHYLAFAYRNLLRNKLHTLINIVGLGVGLMCFVGAYLFVDYSRSFESQFRNADRIYTIYRAVRFAANDYPSFPFVSIALKEYAQANFPDIDAIARSQTPFEGVVSVDGEESYRRIKKVDPEFFQIFDLPLLSGKREDPLGEPGSAVITVEAAEAMFGTRDVVGRTITAENKREVTIVAVMGPVTGPSHLGSSFLESADGSFDLMVRYDWNLDPSARQNIAPNQPEFFLGQMALTHVLLPSDGSVTPAAFTARLQNLVDNNLSKEVATITYDTRPVAEFPMWVADQSVFSGRIGLSITSTILMLGAMVLIIACLNFINLATAQAAARGKEIAMRKILGADRTQVVWQYLTEAMLTVSCALLLAAVLLQLAVPVVNTHLHALITIPWLTQWRLWAFLITVVVLVGLAAGIYPALILAKPRPVEALHAVALRAGPTSLRTLLVGAQFMVASFLLIAVLAMYHQTQSLRRMALALANDPHVVITADLGDAGVDLETLVAELRASPSITQATGTSQLPWSAGGGGLEYTHTADESAETFNIENRFVSYDYFDTLNIGLLAGRAFSRDYASDAWLYDLEKQEFDAPEEVNTVLDRAAARALGWTNPQDAIGQLVYHHLVSQPMRPTRIVGVVESAPFRLVSWGNAPAAGVAYYVVPTIATTPLIRVSRTDVAGALDAIDAVWDRLSPSYPIQRHFVDEDFDRAMRVFENINALFVGLSAFAIFIATMGLFSMATYLCNRRKKEIGIRKSIGASTRQILRLMLWDFLKPVLIANLVAWPLAFIALRAYLAMFVDREPLTPLPFLLSLAISVLVASLAIASRVLQTARISPARVLRVE